ncbi:lipase [Crucibulum laeve]|uniref:Lipase n=1 Tax=Crucibulum laeve TaxID=68775 RepID=A0A5C3M5L7_9AGAR|nr:lipase [Crucibulum laeve]
MVAFRLILSVLAGIVGVIAAPALEARQGISTLSAAEVASFKPYTYYASTAYCTPATTLAWNCGANCNANSGFRPVASGGDGAIIQYWYVGYDPALQTVIVAYQGTETSKILPILTDANFFPDDLDDNLFPSIDSSVKTHDGFGNAQKLQVIFLSSARAVLAAVQRAMADYQATKVTIVGHSLGGAIALVTSVYLPLHLPAGTTFQTITYGEPRVGNQGFVDYVNARYQVKRIVNKKDIVPILPGRFLGFAHVNGEIHIGNDSSWVSCPGQDNTNSQCTIGYTPNILVGNPDDHSGPYDGVTMGC